VAVTGPDHFLFFFDKEFAEFVDSLLVQGEFTFLEHDFLDSEPMDEDLHFLQDSLRGISPIFLAKDRGRITKNAFIGAPSTGDHGCERPAGGQRVEILAKGKEVIGRRWQVIEVLDQGPRRIHDDTAVFPESDSGDPVRIFSLLKGIHEFDGRFFAFPENDIVHGFFPGHFQGKQGRVHPANDDLQIPSDALDQSTDPERGPEKGSGQADADNIWGIGEKLFFDIGFRVFRKNGIDYLNIPMSGRSQSARDKGKSHRREGGLCEEVILQLRMD
jgi:hypothetical protein